MWQIPDRFYFPNHRGAQACAPTALPCNEFDIWLMQLSTVFAEEVAIAAKEATRREQRFNKEGN
ncbi:hypothetical protein H6F60_08940 [Coleofasciculus sp. FACHB-129]|nr:hypothetical protein [Coleofasciculus sp. FACHB-129]